MKKNNLLNILCGLTLFGTLFLQLAVRVEVTRKSYLVENVRQIALENDEKLRSLKLNYAWLSTPDSIQEHAKNALGLSPRKTALMNVW